MSPKIDPVTLRRKLSLWRCYLRRDLTPADPNFSQAIANLQWVWRNSPKIGSTDRFELRGWEALMGVVLRLPPPVEDMDGPSSSKR
jgi:hypothetical protein